MYTITVTDCGEVQYRATGANAQECLQALAAQLTAEEPSAPVPAGEVVAYFEGLGFTVTQA